LGAEKISKIKNQKSEDQIIFFSNINNNKMADEDVQALVVDNGSGMCKVNHIALKLGRNSL
jgi:hypothetical protein